MKSMNNKNQPLPIYIIGAGMAGIACAKQLKQAGKNVIVLEARDRMGGRILSKTFDTITFDLGASWIHGISGNPIYEICQKEKIHTEILNYDQSQYFYKNGKKFSTTEVLEFEEYCQQVTQLIGKHSNLSLSAGLAQAIKTLDYTHSTFDSNDLQELLISFFERIANDPFATDSERLISNYSHYEGYYDGEEVVFPKGYHQVIDVLAKDLPIQYNTTINNINYQQNTVQLTDKNGILYHAEQVVIAVPLGVLQHKKIDFYPPLPHPYIDAIETIGFGSFNKVFFQLEQPLKFLKNQSQHMIISTYYWINDQVFNILDLSKIYHKPTYLMLFGGPLSEWIDGATDQDIWAMITNSLNHLESMPAIPQSLIVTRWGSDPWSHGSFSFPTLNHNDCLHDQLNLPIHHKLFLAGEHCHREYAGTVHGAYLSGIQTAHILLNLSP